MNDFIQLSIHPDRSPTSSVATINGIHSLASFQARNLDKKLYSSGAYYIGKLTGNRRNGWGKLNWSLGCEHEGYYVNNKRDGQGTFTWNDGSIYKGDFKNDLRHGYGELNWPNGESFVGNFENDKRTGYGVYIWPEIGKYEGNFQENKKHGYGIFTMNNGDKFEGIYKEGQRFGPGIFTYASNGEQDVGIWKGRHLLRICSVIEDAFLYEHLAHHKINSGDHISRQIRLSNSARVNVPSTPEIFLRNHRISQNSSLNNFPTDFPYQNIIDGLRTVHSSKGHIEYSSELLLNAAKNGDCGEVKRILEEGVVNANVADKTGFSALMAASVNCQVDVINILLDHGANINQVTDEGLSVLLACHILLYTKENFIESIAEVMPKDNLFNTVDIDKKTGTVINRNERKMIMAIYEDIHLPFNSLKKSKLTNQAAKLQNSKKRALSKFRNKSMTESEFTAAPSKLSDDEEMLVENEFDAWKVEYYQNSMEHVKEVDEINSTFKELMLTNPQSVFLDVSRFGVENSVASTHELKQTDGENDESDLEDEEESNDEEKEDDAQYESICDQEEADKPIVKPFPTTVASIFGYDPESDVQSMTVCEEKHQEDDLILRLMNKERAPHLQNTIQLLLKRGANPNASALPMSALFFAVKAADPAAVLALLQQGADTSARLKESSLCPLHIAVALPCSEGIEITKMLLQYGANPNLRDTFPDGDMSSGRTPLHIVCSREDSFKQCQRIARLLLEYNADPNLLCAGNAPLSLAIGSGNDLIVDTLLKYKADPSLKLTHGLGSIMCVALSFQAERRRTPHERMKLIDKLIKNGADMLIPVRISDKYPPGTVVDYGYHVFSQDRRIACTPYHALSSIEREVYNARRAMLDSIGTHLRKAARKKEEKAMTNNVDIEEYSASKNDKNGNGRDEHCGLRFVPIKVGLRPNTANQGGSQELKTSLDIGLVNNLIKKRLRYCYECGRSIGVRLSPCTRCKEVFYCSKSCKVKAWNIRHREECAKFSGSTFHSQSRGESPTPTTDVNNKQHSISPSPMQKNKLDLPRRMSTMRRVSPRRSSIKMSTISNESKGDRFRAGTFPGAVTSPRPKTESFERSRTESLGTKKAASFLPRIK